MTQTLLVICYFCALFVLALFGLHKFYLLLLYQRYRRLPLPGAPLPTEWPRVVVQLPIYNERYVVTRLLRAVARFDYPRALLEIQVLDDSTDLTQRLSHRLVDVLQRRGFRISHMHRANREGFKAGALANGLGQTSAEIVAVFDADFVPPPDFLKATIPALLQPGVGMVQTRWGHINRNYSLLTRLQAIFLDGHFLVEHLARFRSGKFFNFNGTAGVWRRQAILDGGGWQHDTLTEDLDLSYRAQLAGWRFVFLPDVVAPAELPVEMNGFKRQQHRWAKGSIQTGLKLLGRIWRAPIAWPIKLEATIHLTNNIVYLLMFVPALLLVPIVKIHLDSHLIQLAIIYLLIFFSATVSVALYYACAIRDSLGRLWPHILHVPALMALGIGLSINNGLATLEALLGFSSDFIRTPKFRIERKVDGWRSKRYRPGRSFIFVIELLLGCYFTYGLVAVINGGFLMSAPFLMLFQFGFLYMAYHSMVGQYT